MVTDLGGKIVKSIPLLEIVITSSIPVIESTKGIIGYTVKFYKNVMNQIKDVFISSDDIKRNRLRERLNIPPYGSKINEDLCERLIRTLIQNKAEEASSMRNQNECSGPIEICCIQGWNFYLPNHARWETKGRYPTILQPILSDSILCRDKAVKKQGIFKTKQELEWNFKEIFSINPDLKVYFLIRTASYMVSFTAKYSIFFDQVIGIKLTDRAVISLLIALFDNVTYGRGSVQLLSNSKEIKDAAGKLNDAIHLVIDDTKPDEVKRRETSVDILQEIAIDSRTKYHRIPVVLSNYASSQMRSDLCIDFSMVNCKFNISSDYASSQMRSDLCIDFSMVNGKFNISPAVLTEILEWHDADMIEKIEQNFSDFFELFNVSSISNVIPKLQFSIIKNKK